MWRAASLALVMTACVDIAGLAELRFEPPGAGGMGGSLPTGGTSAAGGEGGTGLCPDGYDDCDGSPDNGCEERLADNDAHCGACDHACSPSACAGTRCENAVIVSNEARPFGIRAAGGSVFWVASDSGAIRRCDLPDCQATVRTIANSGLSAFFLSIDATHVFWNRNSADEIWRCPLDGCLGSEELIAMGVSSPTTSNVGGGYVYWSANEGTVRRVDVAGDSMPELMSMPIGSDGWVAPDGADLYWTTESAGVVRKCQIDDCQNSAVDFATGIAGVLGLDIDATHVYVSTFNGTSDAVYAIPKATGLPEPLAQNLAHVWSVIGLGNHVYWVEADTGLARAVPKNGGSVVELAAGLVDPWNLASDGEFIFITDPGGGSIVRVDPI